MLPRMFSLAILGIGEPHCRCSRLASRSIVPYIGPQPGRLGLALAGSQHRNRRIIGVYFRPAMTCLLSLIDQRRKQLAGRSYPFGQRRTSKVHSFASVDLRLPIQGKMICVLRHQHVRQQPGAGQVRDQSACSAPGPAQSRRILCSTSWDVRGG